uniref:Replication factor A C-terminal domain-containing protein n=1 Tax=Davidia involucrata TaxID=16924 RepID=A0A5B7A6D3_DAVIN
MNQQFYYMSCSNCHRATSTKYMECFTCNYFKLNNVHGIPRCHVAVEAIDSTRSITAAMFGDDAEHFLSCTAISIMQKLNENHESVQSMINTSTDGDIILQVKAYHSEFRGTTSRKFNIIVPENAKEKTMLQISDSETKIVQFPMQETSNPEKEINFHPLEPIQQDNENAQESNFAFPETITGTEEDLHSHIEEVMIKKEKNAEKEEKTKPEDDLIVKEQNESGPSKNVKRKLI